MLRFEDHLLQEHCIVQSPSDRKSRRRGPRSRSRASGPPTVVVGFAMSPLFARRTLTISLDNLSHYMFKIVRKSSYIQDHDRHPTFHQDAQHIHLRSPGSYARQLLTYILGSLVPSHHYSPPTPVPSALSSLDGTSAGCGSLSFFLPLLL
jgi:hypothetical protein